MPIASESFSAAPAAGMARVLNQNISTQQDIKSRKNKYRKYFFVRILKNISFTSYKRDDVILHSTLLPGCST